MAKSIIVYGPQGHGLTRKAKAIARHFGLPNVLTRWAPGIPLPAHGTLALTAVDCSDMAARSRQVIHVDEALRLVAPKRERA